MEYLVIELQPKPTIITDVNNDPAIYTTKHDAFKVADLCKQGLVYPIVDIMKIFEQIKAISRNREPTRLLNELLVLTDEIV